MGLSEDKKAPVAAIIVDWGWRAFTVISMDSCSGTKDMIVMGMQTRIKRTFPCWKCAMDMTDITSSKAWDLRVLALLFIVF